MRERVEERGRERKSATQTERVMAASATHFLFAPASPPPRTPHPHRFYPPPTPHPPHTPSVVTSEPQCLRTETAACFFVDVLFRTLYLRYLCSHSTCFYSIFAAISARKRAQRSLMKLVDHNAWNSAWLMLLAFPWEKRPHFSVTPFKKRKQKLKKAERK